MVARSFLQDERLQRPCIQRPKLTQQHPYCWPVLLSELVCAEITIKQASSKAVTLTSLHRCGELSSAMWHCCLAMQQNSTCSIGWVETWRTYPSHQGRVNTLMPSTGSHGVLNLQEKQKQLEEVNQKVESMHMVEQWQLVQASYHRVIAWQQVAHCICTADVHHIGEPSCPASTRPHLDQVAGLWTGACCVREHQAFPPYQACRILWYMQKLPVWCVWRVLITRAQATFQKSHRFSGILDSLSSSCLSMQQCRPSRPCL